ncbi:MAG TPA: alpha/beta hydrolase-fold protein [Opitutaceae bacterium]|nr:alpha/beta hydrolase-fold protein [Opitutaceae bacterium]
MKRYRRIFIGMALAVFAGTRLLFSAQPVLPVFPLTPESAQRLPGVEPGETLHFGWNQSRIFPGTERVISVYIPRAYTGKAPACLAVFQDKGGFNFEIVIDNLIHRGDIPVMIAVTVPPGAVKGAIDPTGTRHNRTFEYDSPGDRYLRFLVEEILPEVEKLRTAEGTPIRLSSEGKDRMIAGGSSGAAAAFNAAWARPEVFSRVFSAIGSYTGLRGSYVSPVLVQKTEPQALRLFLQSGTQDMWTVFGDWWSANNGMVRALTFAGYEFDHEFGEGRHSMDHGTALFPRAMRFLWAGWPEPVGTSVKSRNHVLKQTVLAGERWTIHSSTFSGATRLRANRDGEVFVSTPAGITQLQSKTSVGPLKKGVLWAFSSDGRSSIVSDERGSLLQRTTDGKNSELAKGFPIDAAVATTSGDVYAASAGKLWRLRVGAQPVCVDDGPTEAAGLAVTGDGNWLAAFERKTTRGFSYQIGRDGELNYKQTFYVLHKQDAEDHSGSLDAAAEASRFGYLYVATAMGVQICDANGRTGAILPLPQGVAAVSLCFGGPEFKTLYVLGSDGKIYMRAMQNPGAGAFRPLVPILTRAG